MPNFNFSLLLLFYYAQHQKCVFCHFERLTLIWLKKSWSLKSKCWCRKNNLCSLCFVAGHQLQILAARWQHNYQPSAFCNYEALGLILARITYCRQHWICSKNGLFFADAIAQWIRMPLLCCGRGSNPKHNIYTCFNLYLNCQCKKDENKQKEAEIWHHLKNCFAF